MSVPFHLALALRGVAAGLLLVALAASVRALITAARPWFPWNRSPRQPAASANPRPSRTAPCSAAAAAAERAARELEEATLAYAYWWLAQGGERR